MSDLGAISYYLGIEVRRGKEELTLGQSTYASKLLERSGMEGVQGLAVGLGEDC